MILRLEITDGRQIPAVDESVELAGDGTLDGWRTVSDGGAGWFAGRLPPDELAALRALTGAFTGPPVERRRPGSGEQTLQLAATGPFSIAGVHDDLADASRRLLDRLTDFPRAAVAVRLASPRLARLVHRGADPLRLDLALMAVQATVWRGYYEPAGAWSAVIDGPGVAEAGPGWTFDIPLELPAEADGGDDITVHLAVDLGIVDGGTRIPVRATLTPTIAPR